MDSSSAQPGLRDKAVRPPRVAVVTWGRINAVSRFGKCATRIQLFAGTLLDADRAVQVDVGAACEADAVAVQGASELTAAG